jgi:hypothetical protein
MAQRVVNFLFIGFLLGLVYMSQHGCHCANDNDEVEQSTRAVKTVRKSLQFFKHEETGLCFALSAYSNRAYLAHVPCDKVSKHLLR